MEFRLLGPLEVLARERPVGLGGRQRRTVLAILLVHAGEAVSTDRLIDELWGESPPGAGRKTVQAHIAHLRRVLSQAAEGDEVIAATPAGYVLTTDPETIDSRRFEQLIEEAHRLRSTGPAEALRKYETALALFRGEPLAGLADSAFSLRVEVSRLEELRLSAVEDRLEVMIVAGRAHDAIPETRRLLSQHPLRERMWAMLMLALYKSGRQGEALQAFSSARQTLAEELGLEPSAELRTLEQQILEQDPSLEETPVAVAGVPDSYRLTVRNPYKGLRTFDEADAADFFGREAFVRSLLERLGDRGVGGRLVVVTGPGGAGKSSAVRAGLLPAVRDAGVAGSDRWFVVDMFPGPRPFESLAKALAEAVDGDSPADLADRMRGGGGAAAMGELSQPGLLLVDQFEEVFALADEEERNSFLALLADLVTDEDSNLRVILTVRADFLGGLMADPRLGPLLDQTLVLVPPLADHEVRAVITQPVARVGVSVDPDLVSDLVHAVASRSTSLPLLQFALADLFERRREDRLTLEAYQAAGGISGGLSRRADEIIHRLEPAERETVRQLCLRLVAVTEDAQPLRRRVMRAELDQLPVDRRVLHRVLDDLGRHRLLTFDQDPETGAAVVEVAHEALLHEWDQLRSWIEEARQDLPRQARLAAAAAEWRRNNRDPSYLLGGTRLAATEEWAEHTSLALTNEEHRFLEESREQADKTERQQTRRRRITVGALSAGLVVVTLLAAFAFTQQRLAEGEARVATARELAAAAMANLEVDPERSMLLALEAVETTRRVDGTVLREAEEALHRAVQTSRVRLRLPSTGAISFSPDGERIVTGGEAVVAVWDLDSGEAALSLVGHGSPVSNAVFSPDGALIATSGRDLGGAIRVWDALTGDELHVIGGLGDVIGLEISPDSSLLAASAFGSGRIQVRSLESGDVVHKLDAVEEVDVEGFDNCCDPLGLAFSPGGFLAAATEVGTVVWDLSTERLIAHLRHHERLAATTALIWRRLDVAFSPDDWFLVTGDAAVAHVWDMDTWQLRSRLVGHRDTIQAVAVSSDSSLIATGSTDGTIRVFEAETGEAVLTLAGHVGAVIKVAFSPDGTLLGSAGSDGTARVWDITPAGGAELLYLEIPSNSIAFSPDGSVIASPGTDGALKLWDASSGVELQQFVGGADMVRRLRFGSDPTTVVTAGYDGSARLWEAGNSEARLVLQTEAGMASAALSPDGSVIATVSDSDGLLRLWDARTGELLLSRSSPVGLTDVAFSPDGSVIASSGFDGMLKLWDAPTLAARWQRKGHGGFDPTVMEVRFSPDGTLVASASFDGTVKLWDVATGEMVASLEGHTGEVFTVDISPDGSMVATGGLDGTVRLWDLDTGEQIMVLGQHPAGVTSVSFNHDGKRLAAGEFGDVVRIYTLDLDDLIEIASSRLTRNLTDAECGQYLHAAQCPRH